MKRPSALLLPTLLLAGAAAAAKVAKPADPLATETDPAKIQALVLAQDYKSVTTDGYMAVMKNLVAAGKSLDISSAEGRKKAGLVFMCTLVYQKKAKNPASYTDGDGKSILDANWFDAKAAGVAKDLEKATKAQYDAKFDDKFSADEKKMKEEFEAAKAAVK